MGKYDDIINQPHHVSKNHPQMSLENRAAQFAPFAALVGYSEAITSSQQLKEEKKIISDDKKEEIEETLHYLNKGVIIEVKYYLTGKNQYITYQGIVKRIDQIEKIIIFESRKSILINDIIDIKLVSNEH